MSKHRAFLICPWLSFFICFLGCEDNVQPTTSLRFKVNLSPSIAAKVQHEAKEVIVYIGNLSYSFPIGDGGSEYYITSDSFGYTTVRVEYRDAEGNILCEGEILANISRFGQTDVTVGLTCVAIPERKPEQKCVDFSSLDEGTWLFRGYIDKVFFHLEDEAQIKVIEGVKKLLLIRGNAVTIELPERSNQVTITAWNIVAADFEAFNCRGKIVDEEKNINIIDDERAITLAGKDICSVKIIGRQQIYIVNLCYQF